MPLPAEPGILPHGAVDAATLAVGILIVPIKIGIRRFKNIVPCATRRSCGVDFLNGTTLVPFLLMTGAAFYEPLLEALKETNRVFLGIAGVMGFLFVIGEMLDLASTEQQGVVTIPPTL